MNIVKQYDWATTGAQYQDACASSKQSDCIRFFYSTVLKYVLNGGRKMFLNLVPQCDYSR